MAASASITELPVPHINWEERVATAFEEGRTLGKNEARETHIEHLREFERDRYRHHRKWTIVGIVALILVAAIVGALSRVDPFQNQTYQQVYEALRWIVLTWLAYFTTSHDAKRSYYLGQTKQTKRNH